MKPEVRTMLENMYQVLQTRFHNPVKSWDYLIDFLATDNCAGLVNDLNHKFEWLREDSRLVEKLMITYDPKLLSSDYYDHLGEMYLDRIVPRLVSAKEGLSHTPLIISELAAEMTVPYTDGRITILDPAAGTGRLLMAAHDRAPNAILFGVDTDLRSVRIAFTNFAIHNIRGYLLNADGLKHELDLQSESGKHNWHYANKWYSCMDKLKPIETRPAAGRMRAAVETAAEDLYEK